MKSIAVFALLLISSFSFGQNNGIKIQIDNDWLTDQYYSAGLEVTYYRFINSPRYKIADKTGIWFGRYGFKIFTPNVYDEESFQSMSQDRPFAGYQYLMGGLQSFSKTNKLIQYNLAIGQIGPKARLENIQRSAHKLVGYQPIFGWEEQIVDEVVFDANFQWIKEWRLDPYSAFSLKNTIQTGTSRNYLQTGINFRFGRFNDIRSSGWLLPSLSAKNETQSSKKAESYFVTGFRLQYVASNIFLEGSLFDNLSPVTITPNSLFFEGDLGIYITNGKVNYAIIGVFQGREFDGGKGHFYLNFNIARSF